MDLNLKNKIALITGASKGIGAAIAKTFAAEGVNLYLTARNNKQLETLKIELQKKYSVEVKTIPLDLTEADSQKILFENCKDINILINNGAIAGQTVFHLHFHLIPRRKNDSSQENFFSNLGKARS